MLTGRPFLHQHPRRYHYRPQLRITLQPILRLFRLELAHMAFSQPLDYCFAVILSHRLRRFDQIEVAGDA